MSELGPAGLQARLDHIAATEPGVLALVDEPDRRARLQRELDAMPAEGALSGWLVGIKDIIHTDGLVTRAGTDLPPRLFARGHEAACVAALRRAGCLVLGKTVTTEFAYFEAGPTRNPHNPAHTPGGSSSGSAAAVAAGFCELALGTQTVGSVIRPAAFCGIVGFKPSYGRLPMDGVLLCSPSVDTLGLFGASVAAVSQGAAVLVDGWNGATQTEGTKPVLGVPEGPYLAQADAQGLEAFRDQLVELERRGYQVRQVPALAEIDAVNARHGLLQAGEMALEHADWIDEYIDIYRPRTREILLRGRQVCGPDLEAARTGRLYLRRQLETAMDVAGIDLWICPSARGPAPRGLSSTGDPVMNLPWTHAGVPVVTVPAGQVGGLPVGLQCVTRFGTDEVLLRHAADLARVFA